MRNDDPVEIAWRNAEEKRMEAEFRKDVRRQYARLLEMEAIAGTKFPDLHRELSLLANNPHKYALTFTK